MNINNRPDCKVENDILGKIIYILKKGQTEDVTVSHTTEWKGIAIDMPKKYKEQHHGSAYEILCTQNHLWCRIEGDLVVDSEKEYTTMKDLEKFECRTFNIHHHFNKENRNDSHMHFMCRSKTNNETIRLINFLKDY